jgi:hypothetical protein
MYHDDDNDTDDLLDTPAAAPAKKKAKPKAAKAGTEAKKDAKKPSKAKVTKAAAPAKEAKPKKAATKKAADDVSTTQPEDKVVLAAVRKLKEPTFASEFAASLGVHRRVIRGQLQRLAKDKANGVKMSKDGFNWVVSAK